MGDFTYFKLFYDVDYKASDELESSLFFSVEILMEQALTASSAITSKSWMTEKKSHLTNLIAIAFILSGYLSTGKYSSVLTSIGFFAFSGAITNWLAVHMLFEKVPFLYGSGVVPCRFEEFKAGIKHLILKQFFTKSNIQRFLAQTTPENTLKSKLLHCVDFEKIYQGLIEAIMKSSLGGMLSMIGGKEALAPMKTPIIEKLESMLTEIINKIDSQEDGPKISEHLSNQISHILDERLTELTPNMVKEIVQEMIQQHLGWLVVWGGVFGGIIGGTVALIT